MDVMGNPRRRALLIGSPVGQLQGVHADIEAMRKTLDAWKFELVERVGPAATREGILCALHELIAWAQAGDAVVIYYSGHGGRCRMVERAGAPPRPSVSFLVPTDVEADGEFRGIAEFELAGLFDDLSLRTKNVTAIFDCCHSATMARGSAMMARDSEVPRTWPHEPELPPAWKQSVVALTQRPTLLDPEGHRDVVRIVATAADSWAFERSGQGGYLTTELCGALAEAREVPLPWEAIIGQVRERVMQRRASTSQRPEVEGPRWRLPFSELGPAYDGERNIFVYGTNGAPWLRAGRLHGLSMGDPVEIQSATPVTGRIIELFDDAARLELDAVEGTDVPGVGAMAVARSLAVRRTVRVDPSALAVSGLVSGLRDSTRLSVVTEAADYEMVLRNGCVEISGPRAPSRRPQEATFAGVHELVADLDRLARAEILEAALASPSQLAQGRNPILWEVEVFVTEPSRQEPRPLVPGEPLPEGSRIYAELRHLSDGMPTLYVNVLDRGVAGRLELVNHSEPAGVQLKALETRWVGRRTYGGPPGMRLEWPECVPRLGVGEETLIFVVSRRPLDLRSLLEGPRAKRDAGAKRSETPADELGTPLPWTAVRVGFGVRS
jgi:hypothetical protein